MAVLWFDTVAATYSPVLPSLGGTSEIFLRAQFLLGIVVPDTCGVFVRLQNVADLGQAPTSGDVQWALQVF